MGTMFLRGVPPVSKPCQQAVTTNSVKQQAWKKIRYQSISKNRLAKGSNSRVFFEIEGKKGGSNKAYSETGLQKDLIA